ncbi:MAG: AtpZ/AtpI family protein [Ignavibacteriales bacterium]|nr:AtpZ/AtpI family protein [Ignavibacteriales bacterium]
MTKEPNSAGPRKPEQPTDQTLREVAPYLTMGIQLAAAIVVFFLIGWWLDTRYETSPMFKLIGLGFGAIGGLIKFLKSAVELGKQEKSANAKP